MTSKVELERTVAELQRMNDRLTDETDAGHLERAALRSEITDLQSRHADAVTEVEVLTCGIENAKQAIEALARVLHPTFQLLPRDPEMLQNHSEDARALNEVYAILRAAEMINAASTFVEEV